MLSFFNDFRPFFPLVYQDYCVFLQGKIKNAMKTTFRIFALGAVAAMAVGCTTHYQIASVERSRILVNNRFDNEPNVQGTAFLAPFKAQVDEVMGPVMGVAARDMDKVRPESGIANLLADVLVWASKDYNEKPDFGVYNFGGIRAALSKGVVTYGDINDIAPFENKIAFTTLTGEKVLELFGQIAKRGGECVSHGVELVITKDGKLVSARLNGEEIDPQREYRVVTLDYIVQGNDGMSAFKDGTNTVSPQEDKDNSRFLIMNYFKTFHAEGKEVDAKVEGRITVCDLNDK